MKEKEINTLILLFGIILIHRLIILFRSQITFYSDDAIYAEIARFWIQGKFDLVFHPTWPPLYPALSAFVYLFVRHWETSLRLVSIVSGALIILPLYYLVKKFTSHHSALLFVLAFSFLDPVIKISLFPMSDMLSTLLIITGITLILYKRFYLASLFFGLTYLTRSEGLMFFVLSLPVVVLTKQFKKIVFYIAIFFILISPYWLAIKEQAGSWSLSQKGSAQIKQGHSFAVDKNGTTWSQEVVSVKSPNYRSEYFRGGLPHVLEYSDWYWFWFKQKIGIWKNVLLQNFPIWSLPFILFGITTIYLPAILLIGITSTIFVTPIADHRYLLWVGILFLVFFFIGVRRLKIPAIFTALSFFLFPFFNLTSLNPINYGKHFTNTYYYEELKDAGGWLFVNKKNPEPTIMIRHEGLEFYTDGKTVYTPEGLSVPETVEYAERNNVDYLIAWERELSGDKNLAPLLDPTKRHKFLNPVFIYPNASPKIIIYELF